MTNKELQELLKQYPNDILISIEDEFGFYEIEKIYTEPRLDKTDKSYTKTRDICLIVKRELE